MLRAAAPMAAPSCHRPAAMPLSKTPVAAPPAAAAAAAAAAPLQASTVSFNCSMAGSTELPRPASVPAPLSPPHVDGL